MVDQIDSAELRAILTEDDALQIVDVRSESAYRDGHIPDAMNVPFGKFTDVIDTVDWGNRIVLVCPHGASSFQAAKLLEAFEGVDDGAQVMNLEDGYAGWSGKLVCEHDGSSSDHQ